ncbi:hypothetical protein OTU49_002892 [Cherax quadricarinatus]|uniref:tRNA N(3)-methylcytidine methyltransferase n=1 Tax=Cherax quadricarinatus TaxID=27406 RepID=A0AAW0XJ38_CHEQU|nr:tRNA N(3)-methylcytidine methyltransferase METTL2-like isoform X2 [Cherax quadricarinatus]
MSETSGHDCPGKRPQFGTRFLKDKKNMFEHNAWDNVVWDENQEAVAQAKVLENSEVTLSAEEIARLEQNAAEQWNSFYSIHQNRFFKDRHWLFTEFPELAPHLAHTFPVKLNSSEAPTQIAQKEHLPVCHQQAGANSQSETPVITREDRDFMDKENSFEIEHSIDNTRSESEDTKVENFALDETYFKYRTNITNANIEMEEAYPGESATFRILEVGCGVGNTVFPILQTNNNEGLFVYCCDFSSTAIDLIKESPDYEEKRCHAFVCDVTSEEWQTPFPKASLDVIVCIFVLSSLLPDKLQQVVRNMSDYLRPGGILLFRDYGRYDMAQLRYKKGRCLSDNFYVRGDGTRCYFFTQEEVRNLMTESGLEEVQNLVDRRLQVNRGKQLTMYRVWVQAKYRKPIIIDQPLT